MEKTAVILSGGLGTRLKPFTNAIPKPLLPIGEKAVLEIQIERLVKSGFTQIVLATNYKADYIENFFGDGSRYGVKLVISKEDKPLGKAYLGGVPVDLITSGYMQAGVIGVIVNSCIILFFIRWLDGITKALPSNCSAIRFWCCCTITTATILSMDLCKLPLAYAYVFILIFLLREKLLQVGSYDPSRRVRLGSKSVRHI